MEDVRIKTLDEILAEKQRKQDGEAAREGSSLKRSGDGDAQVVVRRCVLIIRSRNVQRNHTLTVQPPLPSLPPCS